MVSSGVLCSEEDEDALVGERKGRLVCGRGRRKKASTDRTNKTSMQRTETNRPIRIIVMVTKDADRRSQREKEMKTVIRQFASHKGITGAMMTDSFIVTDRNQ